MKKFIFALAAFGLLPACSSRPVQHTSLGTSCENEFREMASKAKAESKGEEAKFWDLMVESDAGRMIQKFQAQTTCDFMEFRREPKKVCPDFSADTFSSCMKNYLDKLFADRRADSTMLILSIAVHVNWVMKFRKEVRKEKPPLFWSIALADYSLYLSENFHRKISSTEIMGQMASTEAGVAITKAEIETDQKFLERNGKVVAKLLDKLGQAALKNSEAQAHIKALQARADALAQIRSPANKK